MSIAMVITTGTPATGSIYLPVATQETFSAHWLPAAAKLGLVWMPLFQNGTAVPIEAFPDVRAEFEWMREYFAAAPERAPMTEHLRERSWWLSTGLTRLDPASIWSLYVG